MSRLKLGAAAVLVALFTLVGLAPANPTTTTATTAPPQADSVTVVEAESSVSSVTVVGEDYWKITAAVDYIALGNRSIIAQIYSPQSGQWSMMHAVPVGGQTTSGEAFTVAAGQGGVTFTFYIKKNSGWGQYVAAYGYCDPTKVWVGSYSGDTLKAEDNGDIYGPNN